jgi:sirohydrochlorin ferrochelatase
VQALVVAAHGSRREASNSEVRLLAQRLSESAPDAFTLVKAGFLELATPSIPEAITGCVEAGADRIVVVPYFLASGRHVSEDIPRIVEAMSARHAQVAIHVADHIGSSQAMPRLILEAAGPVHGAAGSRATAAVMPTRPAAPPHA